MCGKGEPKRGADHTKGTTKVRPLKIYGAAGPADGKNRIAGYLSKRMEAMEKDLTALRPYTRQEFQSALGGGPPDGMSAERYRASVFDFERAPHIERRGLNEARMIVLSTPKDSYPDPAVYLFACLQRVETFLYECFRPQGLGWGGGDERTLMFKSGVKKVARAVADKLPSHKSFAWSARRDALDSIQNDLWRIELGLDNGGNSISLAAELSRAAETLLSVSPLEMSEFDGPEAFKLWLSERL